MKCYIFFSVHEELFRRVAEGLRPYVESFSGFVWGRYQERAISGHGVTYDPLVVFTRDLLPKYGEAPPDLAWLERRERELGVPIARMLASERHLLAGRTHEQVLRIAEVGLREIAAAYDRIRPDFVFSEDISCFHSYAHFLLARERGIPCWAIAGARVPGRVSIYSAGFQKAERLERYYARIRERGLTADERRQAEQFVADFRARPERPTGMDIRSKPVSIERTDARTFKIAAERYFGDPGDPTMRSPFTVIGQRLRRMARVRYSDFRGVFEPPVAGENYVLFPIHYQPEASTLVQGPMYLNQVALIENITKSLPIGHRLYVKEHLSSRGRRPYEFYRAIRQLSSVRLLGPDEDTWALIKGASAVAVITGTMGWEALLFDRPVVSFGSVFFNLVPHVYRASELPADDWAEMFRRAVHEHNGNFDDTLSLVSALSQASYPGFMANGIMFPDVLEPANVENIAEAMIKELGLRDRPQDRGRPES